MGQAKLRGTKEQRLAEGIAKREAREQEAERKHAEAEFNMTDEQREQRTKTRMLLAATLGLT